MSPQSTARTEAAARRAPQPAQRTREGRVPLSVVDSRARLQRARRRRERLLFAAAGAILASALTVVAASQGVLASQQERLDGLNQHIATAVASEQRLQVTRAELASPSRILEIAEQKLHMIAPSTVTYLTPVSTAPARAVERASADR